MGSKHSKRERREEKLRQRALGKTQSKNAMTLIAFIAFALFSTLFIWGAYKVMHRTVLPPTDIAAHVETSPASHILDEPMPLAQQKHMLEHADGKQGGPPGVVINTNCEDFECEEGLIDKLKTLVRRYPEFIYLAPFENMSFKIAITRLGEIKTFDDYDEAALIEFIENSPGYNYSKNS